MSFTKADVKAIIEEKGLDNLSAKSVRISLEEKLGMEEGSLKAQKSEISEMIDTVLNELPQDENGDDDEEEEEEEAPAPAKKKAKKEPAVCQAAAAPLLAATHLFSARREGRCSGAALHTTRPRILAWILL